MALDNFFSEALWIPVGVALLLVSAFVWNIMQRRKRNAFPRAASRTHHKTVPSIISATPRADTWHSARARHARWQTLTLRERQVAALAAAGKQNAEIAEDLQLSPATIATHLKNIYRKLDIHSRRELANLLQDIEWLDDG